MKKFTLLFLFFSLAMSAQVFPELDPTLLKPGLIVKANDARESGFSNFYEKKYHLYKTKENETPAKELIGRLFEVVEVAAFDERNPVEYYFITLKDTTTGEVLYYKNWVENTTTDELLLVSNLELPDEYYCKYVKRIPGSEESYRIDDQIEIIKSRSNDKIFYFLTLETLPIKKNSGKGTITITLKNGKTIVRKNVTTKAEPSFDGIHESYEADITLTAAEIELLKESEIMSYDFFSLYTEKVPQQTAGVTKGSVNCLIKK